MWSELGLQEALTCPTQRSQSGFSLLLSQAIPHGTSDIAVESETTTHTANDVTSPKGVLNVSLEEILVHLKFSTRALPCGPLDFAKFAAHPLQDALNPISKVQYNDNVFPLLDRDLLRQPLQEWSALSREPEELVMLDTDDSLLQIDVDHQTDYTPQKLNILSNHYGVARSRPFKDTPYSMWNEDASTLGGSLYNQKINAEDFYMLMEASTRVMISGRRSLTTRGIALTSTPSDPTLAEIASPVFSPGFLPVSLARSIHWGYSFYL